MPSPDPSATESIHVSLAIDRGFEMPLAVALMSLAEAHERQGIRCTASVLCTGLDRAVYQRIESDLAGRLDIEWLEVDMKRVRGANFTIGLSSAALFRLLLPELLPDRDRTLYIDADTLVLEPLAALWQAELGSNLLGAVRDGPAPFAAGIAGTKWRDLGFPPQTDYFNSGVLVMPLDLWRSEGTADVALRLLRDDAMPWGDQDALNIVAMNRWVELPRRWNVQTADAEERSLSWVLWREDVESAVAQPAIVHFTEPHKPWTGRLNHPYADLWFAALDRTSWTWRPPSKPTRAVRRIMRAARVLRYG